MQEDAGAGVARVAGGPAPLERVVCQLANEAAFAAGEGVAAPDDIDSAMRLGLNHPRGPFEWVRELGVGSVVATLDALRAQHDDERCDIAPLLRGPAKQ